MHLEIAAAATSGVSATTAKVSSSTSTPVSASATAKVSPAGIAASAPISAGTSAKVSSSKIAPLVALVILSRFALTLLFAQLVAQETARRRAKSTGGPGIHALVVAGTIVGRIRLIVGTIGLIRAVGRDAPVPVEEAPETAEAGARTAAHKGEEQDASQHQQANAAQRAVAQTKQPARRRHSTAGTARAERATQRTERANCRTGKIASIAAHVAGKRVRRLLVVARRERYAAPAGNIDMPGRVDRDDDHIAAGNFTPGFGIKIGVRAIVAVDSVNAHRVRER